jgi:hypothetical protein
VIVVVEIDVKSNEGNKEGVEKGEGLFIGICWIRQEIVIDDN